MKQTDHPSAQTYWKMWKLPSTHHSKMKMMMVPKHPPPHFDAPHPATAPRKSLLTSFLRSRRGRSGPPAK